METRNYLPPVGYIFRLCWLMPIGQKKMHSLIQMEEEGIIEELCPSMDYSNYRILQPNKLHQWFLDMIREEKQAEKDEAETLENLRLTLLKHCPDPLFKALIS